MYIDDGSDAGGMDGELTAEVDGQEYTAAETVDYDHDGVLDAASVATPDGGHLLYVDLDADGVADEAITYDSEGIATAAAEFDGDTGEWVASAVPEPAGDVSAGSVTDGEMRVDTSHGTVDVGVPTVDSDGDGTDDTAIVRGPDGGMILYTDSDGDGSADVATVIDADGSAETLRHTGTHEWTRVDGSGEPEPRSGVVDPTSDGFWGAVGASSSAQASVLRIDSETGQWISPN